MKVTKRKTGKKCSHLYQRKPRISAAHILAVEPVRGRVAGAVVAGAVGAAVRVAAGREDAVDELGRADGVVGGAELEPGDGAGAVGAGRRRRGRVDGLVLFRRHQDGAVVERERRHALVVEVVVANVLERLVDAVYLQTGGGGERVRGRGARVRGVGAVLRVVEVERHGVLREHVAGERGELRVGEGARALLGVQRAGVVEDGEGAGRDGLGALRGAGVVLDAEAEGNVQELESVGRVGELLGCGGVCVSWGKGGGGEGGKGNVNWDVPPPLRGNVGVRALTLGAEQAAGAASTEEATEAKRRRVLDSILTRQREQGGEEVKTREGMNVCLRWMMGLEMRSEPELGEDCLGYKYIEKTKDGKGCRKPGKWVIAVFFPRIETLQDQLPVEL